MVATFIVRLVTERLARGELVGQVECVADGRTATIRAADELERFVLEALGAEPERR